MKQGRMERLEMIVSVNMESNTRWYKNCKNVRNRGGKICLTCPFRWLIEELEKRSAK